MKRRLFLTALFATGTIAAFSDPAQARVHRRQFGYRSRRYYRETADRQPTTYRQVRADEMPVARTSRSRNGSFVDRNQPEFWRSPGEIDRSIVDRLRDSDIHGVSKRQLYGQYGAPLRDEGSQMTWNIGRTSDGIIAPETFTVNLDGDGKVIAHRRL